MITLNCTYKYAKLLLLSKIYDANNRLIVKADYKKYCYTYVNSVD